MKEVVFCQKTFSINSAQEVMIMIQTDATFGFSEKATGYAGKGG